MAARLTLDRTPFNDELRLARADADKFAREGITVPVDADPAKANAKLDKLARRKFTVTGKIDLDDKAANAKLDALKAKADKTIGTQVAEGLAKPPWWVGAGLAALPAAVTVLGTATGAAVALGSALATGGIAFATYGLVARSVIAQSVKAASAVQSAQVRYNASVASGTKQATAYKAEQMAIRLAYAQMSPAQIRLSKELGTMSDAWSGVKKSVTPVIAMSVQPWIGGITSAMRLARPVVTDVSQVVSSLGSSFDALVNLPAFGTFAKFIGTEGSSVVNAGGGALMNFFHGFIILLPQVKPLIDGVDQGITHLGTSFLTWAQSDSARHDIQAFMAWLHDNGPVVGHLLLAIGGALKTLGAGLGAGGLGMEELKLLTAFFGLIAHLPPGFVQPVSDLAASLLIISRFGFGRKVISVAVNWVGGGIAALLKLITGGKIDLAGKFSAAGGMQAAADTMVVAAKAMQAAADTMVGADAGAGGAAGAAGAARAAGAAEGGTAARVLTGILAKANPALWGLMLSGDTGSVRNAPSLGNPASLGVKPGQSAVRVLTSGPAPLSRADALKVISLSQAGNRAAIEAMGLDPAVISRIIADTAATSALDRAQKSLAAAFASGKGARQQFVNDLIAGTVHGQNSRLMTDEYTLAIQRNGLQSSAAHRIRSQMVADFEGQGLNAKQANALVDTYTAGVARNGDTAAARAAVRAQLIRDFEATGLTARQSAAEVDALIRKIADVHSKSVSLSVKAAGTFTITGQSVSAGAGHKIVGGVAGGGLISGPGTGTSDTAGLFALSDKEYVHNAAAVDYYGTAFMEAVNKRRFPKMASGGLAGMFSGSPAGLGSFDVREWAAAQSLIEAADAAAASASLRSAVATATARLAGGAPPGSSGTAIGAVQQWAKAHLSDYGWGPGQFPPLQALWNQESGWRYNATNPSSGAYGIPQSLPAGKMASAGSDWRTNPVTQMRWGLGYIRGVYGSPTAAEAHELAFRWYDRGGYMPPGLSLAYNGTGAPERLERVKADTGRGTQAPLIGSVHIQLPEGGTVAGALRELHFRLTAAQMQSFAGVTP